MAAGDGQAARRGSSGRREGRPQTGQGREGRPAEDACPATPRGAVRDLTASQEYLQKHANLPRESAARRTPTVEKAPSLR